MRCEARFVHHLFDQQASRGPQSAAVISAGIQLTYRELAGTANQLAHHLLALGVGPETWVGVCLERGSDAIRGLLATLKSGGAYLPLDPSLPAARLTQMYEEGRPRVILVSREHAPAFRGTDARLVLIDQEAPDLAAQPVTAPDVRLHADNVAYAIYTSGSAGRPKAVAVSHRSLACVSSELARAYRISPRDRVLQLASLCVDTSVEQILVALLRGATVMLPGTGTVAPTDLLGYLAQEQVTVVDLTPAYWHQLLEVTEPEDEFRYEDQVSAGVIGLVGSPHDDPYGVAWWSPAPRPVIKVGHVHLGRNVRKQLRSGRERTTANASFRRVAQECRTGREPRWFTDTLLESMVALHEQGWAHSIEVWRDGELIGGALGIGVGCVLSGDSLFGRRPDAARIAVADMAARFAAAGGSLIDAQWDSPFLRSLGAELVPRDRYLPVLATSAERRAVPRLPLPARRLIAP